MTTRELSEEQIRVIKALPKIELLDDSDQEPLTHEEMVDLAMKRILAKPEVHKVMKKLAEM